MNNDPKRELLRHLVATIAFRGGVAINGAPAEFAGFRLHEEIRTPAELLAHIGDLMEGSLMLMRGDELRYLNSAPQSWDEEVKRFYNSISNFDEFLASDAPLAQPPSQMVEKITQGPVADALTHVGQIIMLRRVFGAPTEPAYYFEAEIKPGS